MNEQASQMDFEGLGRHYIGHLRAQKEESIEFFGAIARG